MSTTSILVAGFPESGKTTFLAALWHLVASREIPTALQFESLRTGDSSHLNAIAARWRDLLPQERTYAGTHRLVSMNLSSTARGSIRVTFPDLSGEDFREMWEKRDCTRKVADIITDTSGVLLFVHADKVVQPRWVVDDATMRVLLGIQVGQPIPVEWSPRLAPTQVQLVDLLQLLATPPLHVGPRRLAIVLSAWDKVEAEQQDGKTFLEQRLPLLHQFLESQPEQWSWTVFGVSAQGGDFTAENEADRERVAAEVEQLRAIDRPSERIRVNGPNGSSHDLTSLVAWLIE